MSPLNPVKFLHCGVTATKNILTANEQQRQKTMPQKAGFSSAHNLNSA